MGLATEGRRGTAAGGGPAGGGAGGGGGLGTGVSVSPGMDGLDGEGAEHKVGR